MSVATNISSLVVFGDSLSDNGNIFALSQKFLPAPIPAPPYWNGHFSNGPIWAEQLAQLLGVPLTDLAFGGAEANTLPNFPPVDQRLLHVPINLSNQVDAYVAQLNGHAPLNGTTALINIGSNDYESFVFNHPAVFPPLLVASVEAGVEQAIHKLEVAGVQKIILFTLPDLGVTPLAYNTGSTQAFHSLDVANNFLLQIAAKVQNIQVVDTFQLSEEIAADRQSFGFTAPLNVELRSTTTFAPNEVAFFDDLHPTSAAHGIAAAFTDAVLSSDHVQLLNGSNSIVHAQTGSNFIFATSTAHNDTIYGGSGGDIIFAGSGNVTVYGGSGNELIWAGSGNATLHAGGGIDVLETNSTTGTNVLTGGQGEDALIVNRAGKNTLTAGSGNELFVLKENVSLVSADGTTSNFGQQNITGNGHDTLRFIINDQNSAALTAEFKKVVSVFEAASKAGHPGTFQIDGLNVTGVSGLELQVDSVSNNPNTPYLITHKIALSDGQQQTFSTSLTGLMQTAEHWGLLTV